MNIAVSIAYGVYHVLSVNGQTLPIRVAVAAICYFLINTLSIAGVIAVTENRNLRKIWNECYFWSFPYYLVSVALAAVLMSAGSSVSWKLALAAVPLICAAFLCYRLLVQRFSEAGA